MSARLDGTVTVPKDMATDDLWLMEPFGRNAAWLDLWLLANDSPRTLKFRDVTVTVERGQCARSIAAWGERWRWGRKKVETFLVELQDARKIIFKTSNLTTVITVIDYTIYNADSRARSEAEGQAEGEAEADAEHQQKLEVGRLKVEGEPAKHAPEIAVPGRTEFLEACRMRGIPDWRSIKEFNWRNEKPTRWPQPNWQYAVTTLFDRWVDEEGAPNLTPSQRNDPNSEKNGARRSRMEILQAMSLEKNPARLAELEKERDEL